MNYFSRFRGATTLPELRTQFDKAAVEFERKALHHFNRFGDADQLAFAQALISGGQIDGSFVSCSARARWEYQDSLFKSWKKRKKADAQREVRFVTIILPTHTTSDERTVINRTGLIADSRRIASRMAPDYTGMIEFQASANVRHAHGGKEACGHAHVISEALDHGDQAYKVAQQVNARLGPLPNGMMPVDVTEACLDDMSLARAVAYAPKLPARCKTLYLNPKTRKANQHESTKGDRMIRYERQLEILSGFSLRDLVFAGGDGRAIKTQALRSLSSLPVSARFTYEQIQQFWKEWRQHTGTRRFLPVRIT